MFALRHASALAVDRNVEDKHKQAYFLQLSLERSCRRHSSCWPYHARGSKKQKAVAVNRLGVFWLACHDWGTLSSTCQVPREQKLLRLAHELP